MPRTYDFIKTVTFVPSAPWPRATGSAGTASLPYGLSKQTVKQIATAMYFLHLARWSTDAGDLKRALGIVQSVDEVGYYLWPDFYADSTRPLEEVTWKNVRKPTVAQLQKTADLLADIITEQPARFTITIHYRSKAARQAVNKKSRVSLARSLGMTLTHKVHMEVPLPPGLTSAQVKKAISEYAYFAVIGQYKDEGYHDASTLSKWEAASRKELDHITAKGIYYGEPISFNNVPLARSDAYVKGLTKKAISYFKRVEKGSRPDYEGTGTGIPAPKKTTTKRRSAPAKKTTTKRRSAPAKKAATPARAPSNTLDALRKKMLQAKRNYGDDSPQYQRAFYAYQNARTQNPSKAVTIPKGKRKGDTFTKGGVRYTVVSYTRNGKRIRFAKRV